MEIEARIAGANGRLKSAKVGVRIEMIGDRLYLRATLPPKPDSTKKEPYQQRIALGIRANPLGVKEAEAEARKLGALLDCREFAWTGYQAQEKKECLTVSQWIDKFEKEYFTRRERSPKSETTWRKNYMEALKRLPQEEPLSGELLLSAIANTKPDTRTRQNYCMVYGQLAKLAGLEIDLKKYQGDYSPKKVVPRDLPSDQDIFDRYFTIPSPPWQFVYGLMATYGLRNHEVFLLDLSELPIATVKDGKTGGRRVWACYPEWVEVFALKSAQLPEVTGANNSDLGSRVTTQFARYGLFAPYTLRHCWAVRTLEFGFPVELAAMQMGHSLQVHTEIYHHWISDRHHQRAYDLIMSRVDRPQAPERSP